VQWECEFDASEIIEQKPELLTHSIVMHSPLNSRDAHYGGRTEAIRLHHKIDENETIQYCDVISLYPHISKYYKFPIGHPVIHVGDTCKNIEACLQMEGLMYWKSFLQRTCFIQCCHLDVTRNFVSACVEHASYSKTCAANVNIFQTLKWPLVARGSFPK